MPAMPSMPGGHSSSSKLKRSDPGSAGLLTLVLVVVSLVIFTLGVNETGSGIFSAMRNVTQTIVSPLRFVGASMVSPFTGIGNVFRNLTADEKTLSELEDENAQLSARNVELEEAEVTAKQLQELLDLRSTYNLQSTAAHIIAGSTDSWISSVTIDKGSSAGLAVGMPVVDGHGAIGQLIECAAATSTVRLLSDEGSSVSAMVQSSRAQGMLEGSPDGTLHLSFIRTDQTVNVGDIVVTGGLGGVFPKGLPLGKVSTIESTPGSTYYNIVVEPYSTVSSLEEVMVITSLTEEQEATSEDIEQADADDLSAASGRGVASGEDSNADGEKTEQDDSSSSDAEASGEGQDEGTETGKTTQSSVRETSSSSQASDDTSEDEDTGFVSPHSTR